MLRSREGHLRIFVDPDWRNLVQAEDRDYISEILVDFRQRAQHDPEGLFEQVKSLAVGPLLSHSEGTSVAEDPGLLKRCDNFVEFRPPGLSCSHLPNDESTSDIH